MKQGLYYGAWVIPKEPAFAFMLPEANVLSLFDIEKPLFTQSKNQILEFIRNLLPTHSGEDVLLNHFSLVNLFECCTVDS